MRKGNYSRNNGLFDIAMIVVTAGLWFCWMIARELILMNNK